MNDDDVNVRSVGDGVMFRVVSCHGATNHSSVTSDES
jgi:hypothetical protein